MKHDTARTAAGNTNMPTARYVQSFVRAVMNVESVVEKSTTPHNNMNPTLSRSTTWCLSHAAERRRCESSRATHRRCNRLRSNTVDADAIAEVHGLTPRNGMSAGRRQRPSNMEANYLTAADMGHVNDANKYTIQDPGVHYADLRG